MPIGTRWGECVFKFAPPSPWGGGRSCGWTGWEENDGSRPGVGVGWGIRTRGGAPGMIRGLVAAG